MKKSSEFFDRLWHVLKDSLGEAAVNSRAYGVRVSSVNESPLILLEVEARYDFKYNRSVLQLARFNDTNQWSLDGDNEVRNLIERSPARNVALLLKGEWVINQKPLESKLRCIRLCT